MSEMLARLFSGPGEWWLLLGPLLLAAYFAPFFIAAGRRHRFVSAIGVINLVLGWTGIGWLAALVWAVNRDVREAGDEYGSSGPLYYLNEPRLNDAGIEPSVGEAQAGETRQCAFCAESIKAQARVCRFCGHEVLPGVPPATRAASLSIATMELNIQELQALLKDHEESVQQRLEDVEPATNYVAPQEENSPDVVPLEVAHQLSGWKKFG